ncbi:MAG: hypothetical protein U9N33_04960 [Campylobacterota bacterium]|nr:hypothetical protein [Campylobacterota bacterium]
MFGQNIGLIKSENRELKKKIELLEDENSTFKMEKNKVKDIIEVNYYE